MANFIKWDMLYKNKNLILFTENKGFFYIADMKVILIDSPICWASKGSLGGVSYVNDGLYIVQQSVISQDLDKLDRYYVLINI